MGMLINAARIAELAELEARIAALEEKR